MSMRFWLTVVLVAGICNAPELRLAADETEEKSDTPATTVQGGEAKKEDEAKPEEKKPDLMTLLRTGPIEEAAKALDEVIAADAENVQLQSMRSLLANRLATAGDIAGAIAHAEILLQFQLAHSGEENVASGLVATTLMLRSLYPRNDQASKVGEVIEQSLAALKPHVDADAAGTRLVPFAQLIGAKAQAMLVAEDFADAETLLAVECDSLKARMDTAVAEQAVLAWGSLMQTRVSNATRSESDAAPLLAAELDATIVGAVEKNPESTALMSEFLRMRLTEISRIMRDEPEAAQQKLEQTVAAVEVSPLKDDAELQRTITQLKSYEARIASAKLVKEMIGKPAPEFDIEAWAHGEGLSPESLKGKVVMLDFWAIWCGPCIATFPHLKEWHEEFHSQGFEIVGVTRQFNYEWNAETERPARAKEDVSLEAELEMLDKFMSHHELPHASIVTPKGSDMNKRYGVTGIPHAVLIDRQGNVRMVKIGSGASNASALREMIVQLLAE